MVADVLLHAALQEGRFRGSAGELEQKFRDGATLGAVAAEQWLSLAEAARDQGKLPGEIECVLHAGVHPLTASRAVDVRSVAGNKNAARTVVLNLTFVDAEVRQPDGIAGLYSPRTARIA